LSAALTIVYMCVDCRRHDQAVQHAGNGVQVVRKTGYRLAQTGGAASSCIAAGYPAVGTPEDQSCTRLLNCIMRLAVTGSQCAGVSGSS
jgi:hypothetical protein